MALFFTHRVRRCAPADVIETGWFQFADPRVHTPHRSPQSPAPSVVALSPGPTVQWSSRLTIGCAANLCAPCGGEGLFCCPSEGDWTCGEELRCTVTANPFDGVDANRPYGLARICVASVADQSGACLPLLHACFNGQHRPAHALAAAATQRPAQGPAAQRRKRRHRPARRAGSSAVATTLRARTTAARPATHASRAMSGTPSAAQVRSVRGQRPKQHALRIAH